MKTVFDVTHALTQGIIEREVIEERDDGFIITRMVGGYNNKKYLHKGEWTDSIPVAMGVAFLNRTKKIESLKKQIEKLEGSEIKLVRLADKAACG